MSRVTIATLAFCCAATMSARAQSSAFAGTWAEKPAQCRLGQEAEGAPMVIRRDGYDEHETHCRFTSVRQRGAAWAIAAQCVVDGDNQRINMTLTPAGDRLQIGGDFSRTLRRCH